MNSFLEVHTGLWFLDPWMLLLVLFLPVALLARRRRGEPAIRLAPAGFLGRKGGGLRIRLLFLPRLCQVLALLLVVLALARPVLRTPLPRKVAGIDILLCLDTSSSMTGRDMDPRRTRLDVAKDAAARFVEGRPHDRIGLIRFARFPDLLCPLTTDHHALLQILADVEPVEREGPEDVTGIGTVVARAAQLLERTGAKSKVVILLTDGAENVATAQTPEEIGPIRAGRLCQALGVRVYTIAAGAAVDSPDGRTKAVDTSQIERLAALAGGRFYRARDAGAVVGVYASIDGLEKVEREEPEYAIEERFLLFLAGAFVLLGLGRLLRATVLEVLP